MKHIKQVASRRDYQRKLKEGRVKKPQKTKALILTWIARVCDARAFEGLQWVDRQRGEFRASWIHQRASHWCALKAAHCKAWAEYKNHLKDKENRNLKAGFRTTLNSKIKSNEVQKLREIKTKKEHWVYWRIIGENHLSEGTESSKKDDSENDRVASFHEELSSHPKGIHRPVQPESGKRIEEILSDEVLPHFDAEFGHKAQKIVLRRCSSNQRSSSYSAQKETNPDSAMKGEKSTCNKVRKQRQKKQKDFRKSAVTVRELLEGSPRSIPQPELPAELDKVNSPPRFPLDYWDQPTPPSQPSDVGLEIFDVSRNLFHMTPLETQQTQSSLPEYHSYIALNSDNEIPNGYSPPSFDFPKQQSPVNHLNATGNNENSFYAPRLDFSSQLSPPLLPADILENEKMEHSWSQASFDYTSLQTPPTQSWDTTENNAQHVFPSPYNPSQFSHPCHQDGFDWVAHPSIKTRYSYPPLFQEPSNVQSLSPVYSLMPFQQVSRPVQKVQQIETISQHGNLAIQTHQQHTVDCHTAEPELVELPTEVMIFLDKFFNNYAITLTEQKS